MRLYPCVLWCAFWLRCSPHHRSADDDDDEDEWDEDDGDEVVGTPLDDMDPFVSFTEVLAGVQSSMPARYGALMAGADANVTAALQAMSAHAADIKAKKAAEQQQQQ